MRISRDGVVLDTSASANTYQLSSTSTRVARRGGAIESSFAAAARSKTSTFRVDVREDTIVQRDGGDPSPSLVDDAKTVGFGETESQDGRMDGLAGLRAV